MRGRKPDAKAVRRSDGGEAVSSAISATTTAAVEVQAGALSMPPSVAAHPHMAELWTSMVGRGLAYDERDAAMVEQMVFDLEMVDQCRRRVMGEDGQMRMLIPVGEPDPDTGEYEKYVPNPYIKQMREATAESLKLADQLGLTPLARARLGLTQAAGKAVTLSIAEQIDAAMRRQQ